VCVKCNSIWTRAVAADRRQALVSRKRKAIVTLAADKQNVLHKCRRIYHRECSTTSHQLKPTAQLRRATLKNRFCDDLRRSAPSKQNALYKLSRRELTWLGRQRNAVVRSVGSSFTTVSQRPAAIRKIKRGQGSFLQTRKKQTLPREKILRPTQRPYAFKAVSSVMLVCGIKQRHRQTRTALFTSNWPCQQSTRVCADCKKHLVNTRSQSVVN